MQISFRKLSVPLCAAAAALVLAPVLRAADIRIVG